MSEIDENTEEKEVKPLTKKQYWAKMKRYGYTKEMLSEMTGSQISSFYNWEKVPVYAMVVLSMLEKIGDDVLVERSEYERLRGIEGALVTFGEVVRDSYGA